MKTREIQACLFGAGFDSDGHGDFCIDKGKREEDYYSEMMRR